MWVDPGPWTLSPATPPALSHLSFLPPPGGHCRRRHHLPHRTLDRHWRVFHHFTPCSHCSIIHHLTPHHNNMSLQLLAIAALLATASPAAATTVCYDRYNRKSSQDKAPRRMWRRTLARDRHVVHARRHPCLFAHLAYGAIRHLVNPHPLLILPRARRRPGPSSSSGDQPTLTLRGDESRRRA